jgi:hypothetical protein
MELKRKLGRRKRVPLRKLEKSLTRLRRQLDSTSEQQNALLRRRIEILMSGTQIPDIYKWIPTIRGLNSNIRQIERTVLQIRVLRKALEAIE